MVIQHQVPFSSLCFSTVFFFILFLLFVQFVSCRFVFVFCGSINAEILLVYNDTWVKRSEIRCKLACEKIFDLLAPASYNMTGTEAAYYTDLAAALFRPSLFWTFIAFFFGCCMRSVPFLTEGSRSRSAEYLIKDCFDIRKPARVWLLWYL